MKKPDGEDMNMSQTSSALSFMTDDSEAKKKVGMLLFCEMCDNSFDHNYQISKIKEEEKREENSTELISSGA